MFIFLEVEAVQNGCSQRTSIAEGGIFGKRQPGGNAFKKCDD